MTDRWFLEPAEKLRGLLATLGAVERHREGDDAVDGPVGSVESPASAGVAGDVRFDAYRAAPS